MARIINGRRIPNDLRDEIDEDNAQLGIARKVASTLNKEDKGTDQDVGVMLAVGNDPAKRLIAKGAESLPEQLRRTFIEDLNNPDKIVEDIAISKQGKQRGEDGNIKNNFMDALTFFLPTAIGALVGGAFEGTEGAVAGAESATSLGAAFREHNLKRADLDLKRDALDQKQLIAGKAKPSKFQQTDFVDKKGNPITYDASINKHVLIGGKVAEEGDFKDPIDARQAKNLLIRERTTRVSELKLRHSIDKDAQLSDKQVTKFEGMTNVLDALDRIEGISGKVSTGLGRQHFQNFAEFAGVAPKEFTLLKQETAKMLADYVQAISGAQVGEQEVVRLQNIIPRVSDTPNVFQTKLDNFRKIVKANKEAFKTSIMSLQPLKKFTLLGLDKAEKNVAKVSVKAESSGVNINTQLDIIKRIKAKRNK